MWYEFKYFVGDMSELCSSSTDVSYTKASPTTEASSTDGKCPEYLIPILTKATH